ncbi:CAMK family protein kinase [Tritrichomonas foetus]|uniref:CAMK family protein kinase n=1 Tax=Tritrichomonas foetus TaxID=1144522 RepID=A0A1J4KDQ3_9EUKA|nr:CAMK family protein kinase [Tritrichomonas foetus]|eukprot:OHT09561.1 CAMK family protein kinase [Tritrichomonas foetus]
MYPKISFKPKPNPGSIYSNEDNQNNDNSQSSHDSLEGSTIRNYVFHEVIGKGGYATIYRVTSILFNQDFAAKVMHVNGNHDKWENFQQEVEALKRLDHENIILLYDAFKYENNYVMILEYCEHGSLANELGENGLPPERLISIIYQIGKALQYMHDNNFAHCDLKPQNILIDKYGRAKLSDFGLTVITEKNEMKQEFRGTPVFTPPEIIKKRPHSKFLADLWSFGVMICVLANGQIPWNVLNPVQMKTDICNGYIVMPRNLRPDFIKIIRNTVVLRPENRMPLKDILAFPCFDDCDKIGQLSHQNQSLTHVSINRKPTEPLCMPSNGLLKKRGYFNYRSLLRLPFVRSTSSKKTHQGTQYVSVHENQVKKAQESMIPLGRMFSSEHLLKEVH